MSEESLLIRLRRLITIYPLEIILQIMNSVAVLLFVTSEHIVALRYWQTHQ